MNMNGEPVRKQMPQAVATVSVIYEPTRGFSARFPLYSLVSAGFLAAPRCCVFDNLRNVFLILSLVTVYPLCKMCRVGAS